MACICRCRCCRSCCSELWTIFRGWIILILYGAIGWFLFSYTEDDLNVIDCFRGLDVVAAKHYPDETKRAALFFSRLGKLTNQTLSVNESTAVYFLFYGTFKGSETVPYDRDLFSWNLCIKWYRFSVVTITAIGKHILTRWDLTSILVYFDGTTVDICPGHVVCRCNWVLEEIWYILMTKDHLTMENIVTRF